MTTTQNFLLVLGVGSGVIAFWLVIRFPERGPTDMQRAVLYALFAFSVGWVTPSVTGPLIGQGYAMAMVALFAVVLPVLVFIFVSCAWMLKVIHESVRHLMR
jgi:hypothetical protein